MVRLKEASEMLQSIKHVKEKVNYVLYYIEAAYVAS